MTKANWEIRNLGNEMVTLYVGPKRKKFIVHKKLICDSADYFDKAFNGRFKEGREGIMHLPGDKPGAFSLFIDWLYRSTFPVGNSSQYLNNLYYLWVFATKICHTKLADNAMDRIRDTCKDYDQYISCKFIQEIWDITAPDAQLRSWVLDLKIHEILTRKELLRNEPKTFVLIKADHYKSLWQLLKNDFMLFEGFISRFECIA
jgi:hypothetical protein